MSPNVRKNICDISEEEFVYVWTMSLCLVNRDVLPFPLELPDAIAKATTHRQLEAISHMGQGNGGTLSSDWTTLTALVVN